MKIRESGMPNEEMWNKFFDFEHILKVMGINGEIEDIADFGCGYGSFTIPVAKTVKGKVYAIDIEPEMLNATEEKAKENELNNIETKLRDFISEGSGLKDESVDYVMLFNILHAEKPEKLLEEAYRILKQRGKLGIIHWNHNSSTPRGPTIKMRPKPKQCIEWAKNSRFKNPKKYDLNPHHYGIVMKK